MIRDKRVLQLIGKYLRRGAMVDGLVEASVEGTPQGAAAERTLVSIQAWIEKHLRLQVNAAKSGTGRVWERKFLGFRLDRKKRIGIAPVSLGEIQIQSEGDVGWQAKPHQ